MAVGPKEFRKGEPKKKNSRGTRIEKITFFLFDLDLTNTQVERKYYDQVHAICSHSTYTHKHTDATFRTPIS